MEPLTQAQLDDALPGLEGWTLVDDGLVREFTFADFRAAIAFIVRVGFEAEQRNHHPELTNVWNRVGLRFTTHDAGNRVTQADVDMAQAANVVA